MTRTFLIRGMICGIAAGFLVFLYARLFGESSVAGAIGFEEQIAHLAGAAHDHGDEIVSRDVQSGWGLFVGVIAFSTALGGLFSLLCAYAWGGVGKLSARATAALLAGACFVAVYLVPFLKYPANPPSIGNADTIGTRTQLYFGMIVISVVAMVASLNLGRSLARRLGIWNAAIAGGATYLGLVIIAAVLMPAVNEVPEAFPATLLWSFRTSALVMQLILWAGLGLLFGELTQRSLTANLTASSRVIATPARR